MPVRKMPYIWRDEDTAVFLKLYSQHECLWNTKSADYKDENKCEEAYVALRDGMQIKDLTVHDVKSQSKTIRVEFRDREEVMKSWSNVEDVPAEIWFELAARVLRTAIMRRSSPLSSAPEGEVNEATQQPAGSPALPRLPPTISNQTELPPKSSIFDCRSEEEEDQLYGYMLALGLGKLPESEANELMEMVLGKMDQLQMQKSMGGAGDPGRRSESEDKPEENPEPPASKKMKLDPTDRY